MSGTRSKIPEHDSDEDVMAKSPPSQVTDRMLRPRKTKQLKKKPKYPWGDEWNHRDNPAIFDGNEDTDE